jgi:apolipoprotein N-acyltransferase
MTVPVLCGLAAAFLLLAGSYVHGSIAWLVAAPLVLARCGHSWRRAGALGLACAVTIAVGGEAHWVGVAGERYFGLPGWTAAALVAMLALGAGLTYGLVLAAILRYASGLRPGWTIVAVGAGWSAWESLTTSAFPYYPWASLAATQAWAPVLLQVASVAGQGGLSFAMAAAGACLGLALRDRGDGRVAVRCALGAVGIPLAVTAFGWTRMLAPRPASPPTCRLSAVDARISSGQLPRDRILRRYRAMTRRAARSTPAVIVWPESALPGYLERDGALQEEMRRLAASAQAAVIAGGPRADWSGRWQQRLFNSAYLVDSDGPLQVYDKRQLVPFAEYWPRALGRRPQALQAEEVQAGKSAGVFVAAGCRLGVLICFEAEQPRLARELVLSDAQALLVLSNDAQLPARAIANELAQAHLRAVETGLPVVRAANRGASVVIDRYGVTRGRPRRNVLTADLGKSMPALAVHFAPAFDWLCWVTLVLAAWVGRRA